VRFLRAASRNGEPPARLPSRPALRFAQLRAGVVPEAG